MCPAPSFRTGYLQKVSCFRLGTTVSKPGGCPHSLYKGLRTVAILPAFVASTVLEPKAFQQCLLNQVS
ncbi:hypothetical protein V5799_006926 [Amblyomma americanum]|uniref:Uncharacterized protein n=1 Tax=Amblyomma americanum TaxID=6943 RepID=A0AAQ4DUZ9_AMBAM